MIAAVSMRIRYRGSFGGEGESLRRVNGRSSYTTADHGLMGCRGFQKSPPGFSHRVISNFNATPKFLITYGLGLMLKTI